MIQDHSPVPIEGFGGLFGIDSYNDSVPNNYSIDELNLITYGNELKTRDGFNLSISSSGITRFAIYRRQGESARILALIGTSIHDLTEGTTILTVSGMTDFAINYANNRAYISPHNGVSGLPGEFTYLYNGTGTARKAAGNPPVAGFTVAISATAGVVEAGTHILAWVYETDSGFVTAPGPAQTIVTDGTKALDFTNVPVGPSGTAARRLIASRSIQDYNGDIEGYEMFFVSGGKINNNTDTTLSGVDFFDADLQITADYTYDQLSEIPSVVFIATYGNLMCFGGPDSDKNLVWVSKALEGESIHSSAGFLTFDPFETEGVKDATEFRGALYVTKRTKTYTVTDNTYEASTWQPVTIDSSIGSDVNGIARFYDSKGAKVEFFIVSSPAGCYKFSGTYEEVAISKNIKTLWERINPLYLNKAQTIFDQEKLLLYILVPLDGATENSHIIVGNYENGFSFDRIRWHLWTFADFAPSSIGIDRDSNKKSILKTSSLSGNIYSQEVNRHNDVSTAIQHYVKFGSPSNSINSILHIGALGLRIKGSGSVTLEIYGQDDVDYQLLGNLTLSATPGREYTRDAFFQSEKAFVKLSMNNVGSYLSISRINVYTNVIYNSRPNV